nr:hypothetical protein [Tanacetum cinerariifolium]
MQKNLVLIEKYFKKIYKPTNNYLKTSSNSKNKNVDTIPWFKNDDQSGQFRNQRTECRKPKRVKDSAYHKEKMLLCKQAEQGVPLQAEQCDWLADTNEEVDEQELEAHYSYMAKIQEVPTAYSGTDSEPNEKNDVESDDERVALANLKLDVDENKKIQKKLKKANTTLAQELKECKAILAETSKSLGESISVRDSFLVALQTKQAEFEKYKAFNDRTVDYDKLKQIVDNAWIKHSKDQFCAPTAQDMEILIQTCLMPLAIKTQNDSFKLVHELKQEMHVDLKYIESLEKEIDELESYKAEFSDMYDVILQECVKERDCLAQKLSKQTESVSKKVYTELLQRFAKVEKQSISLEIALQKCKEQVKNDILCNEKAFNVFRKERKQYFEIQDLKAKLQDKNIAISELKKLIEKGKGKYVDTKSTCLTPPAPVPTVDKSDEMILQDILQVSLTEYKSREEQEASENVGLVDENLAYVEIEKMVEGQENVIGDSSIPRNDDQNIPCTRLEPKSDKVSPEVDFTNVVILVNVYEEEEEEDEITNEAYELKQREKGKNVEESRITPFPIPIRSPRIHTDLVYLDIEKLHELTITDTTPSSSSPSTKARFMPRKSFASLANNLHDAMAESLPTMVDKHVKEPVQQQVPEQMKFNRLYVPQTTCRTHVVRLREQDDPHDDAHPEGENSVKRQKTSEYEAYVSGESLPGQENKQEQGPSTSAKIKKIADEMLRQRCTSGSSGPEKIVLSLYKFHAVIFNDDDIEEQTFIFYIRKQKEPGKPNDVIYSNSKIIQVIKTYWELGHERKFITEIVARRANECIVLITKPNFKNINKNDIKDMYLLIINAKADEKMGFICEWKTTWTTKRMPIIIDPYGEIVSALISNSQSDLLPKRLEYPTKKPSSALPSNLSKRSLVLRMEVIENGATLPKTQVMDGVITMTPITTAEEKAKRRLGVKAISTLMMGIPNEHQLKFNSIKDTLKVGKSVGDIRNKANVDTMSMDDLYNNLKVYESEVKGMSSSNSNIQKMAFLSSTNRSTNGAVNTTQAVNTANGISTASTQVNATFSTNIDNLSDDVICAFLASQSNSPQLTHEDLEQFHPNDIKEMDLRWQMAMLTMRARRECRAPRNQDNKHKVSTRRSVPMETPASTALVSCDGPGGFDWKDIKVLKVEIQMKDITIKELRRKLEVAQKEKDGIQLTVDKLENASKGLNKLIECQLVDNYKKGLRIENLVDHKVKAIRCDNGTEFKSKEINQFCEMKGIMRQFSVARTPQQNGVADRRNKTLIEAARAMLVDSKLLTTFWAEAVNIACYVQNRVEHLVKFDGKADEGFFIGYSLSSKAFRVFNNRTRIVEENLHIMFSKNTPNVVGSGPDWLFDIDALKRTLNYEPIVAGTQSNGFVSTKANDNARQYRKET